MFGEKPQKRFAKVCSESVDSSVDGYVILDTETGVQYFMGIFGFEACGMTVLVDRDGKPLIHPEYR